MRVNATVQNGHDVNEVADRLSHSGMRVDQKLSEIGIITGEAAEENLEALGHLPGVLAVEPEGHFQLPPPDAPVQ